jgi:sugar phosphate isomerase/epimerase
MAAGWTGMPYVKHEVEVDAHLWVYASKYPPDWDCTPILDQVFSDLKAAGFAKVELMESILRHEGAVERIRGLIDQHGLPVMGCSYYGDFWDVQQQQRILADCRVVIERLHAVGATMIGLTVGDAEHVKTPQELDVQADGLRKIIVICKDHGIQPNLHNHTFEVTNGLHDLKGTLERIPDIRLGPDLNWLVRAGVDPVWFIRTYGHQMVYMHLRDQDAGGKWTEALGEGVINFPAIAKALRDIGYKGSAAVELAFDKPPVRSVREDWMLSRQYVKKVFKW